MLNLIRIIYSHYIFHKYYKENFNKEDVVIKVNFLHTTYWLTNLEICSWVEYLLPKYPNWNKYQMWREVKYHNVLYKYNLFKSHTNYADFEEIQTFKTYLRRFVGNILI